MQIFTNFALSGKNLQMFGISFELGMGLILVRNRLGRESYVPPPQS